MSMTVDQERHLARIKSRFTQLMDAKYRVGQHEHKNNLWQVKCLPEVLAETLDLAAYVLTLEEQVEQVKTLCVEVNQDNIDPREAVKKIGAIL